MMTALIRVQILGSVFVAFRGEDNSWDCISIYVNESVGAVEAYEGSDSMMHSMYSQA